MRQPRNPFAYHQLAAPASLTLADPFLAIRLVKPSCSLPNHAASPRAHPSYYTSEVRTSTDTACGVPRFGLVEMRGSVERAVRLASNCERERDVHARKARLLSALLQQKTLDAAQLDRARRDATLSAERADTETHKQRAHAQRLGAHIASLEQVSKPVTECPVLV